MPHNRAHIEGLLEEKREGAEKWLREGAEIGAETGAKAGPWEQE